MIRGMPIPPPVPTPSWVGDGYRTAGHWSASETLLTRLATHVTERGDAPAVVDDRGVRMSYRDLDDASSRLAATLSARGIGVGDVVGVQVPNWAEGVVAVCAVEKVGGVVNTLVPMYRDREVAFMSATCGTKALICPGLYRRYDYSAMASRVAAQVETLSVLISLGEAAEGVEAYADLLEEGGAAADYRDGRYDAVRTDPDAVTAVIFTSGTESDPKGAVHSHNTLLYNNRELARLLDLGPDDAIFMASPLMHSTGFGFGLRLAVYLGSKLVLQDGWEPRAGAAMMAAEACTYTHASTPFAQDLLAVEGLDEVGLTTLRYFVCGGASVPPGFAAQMQDRLGATLLRFYGQTEGWMTSINRPEDPLDVLDAFDGRAPAGVEIEIRDDDGVPVPAGERGEATCRGPHRCLGFINDPERTARTITQDGWLKMGDICTVTDDGHLAVVGRKKEVINRGGYKFSPREIEDLLAMHEAISRVVVVKMPDPRLGEKACAFVILKAGHELALPDLVAYLKTAGVAPYKWPERLEVRDELPTTPSGKVQKFLLEQELVGEAVPSA
jgi:acyl-CoA synthetase (AMP-forming)/AMP-acid ligase II